MQVYIGAVNEVFVKENKYQIEMKIGIPFHKKTSLINLIMLFLTIFLNSFEIWKIGKTCAGEEGRYKNGLPDDRLEYIQEFSGTALQCLIIEKVKLYAYFYYPENQQRTNPLHLPPGNKIYR